MIIQCKRCREYYEVLNAKEEFVGSHIYAKFTYPIYVNKKQYLGIKCSKDNTITLKSIDHKNN